MTVRAVLFDFSGTLLVPVPAQRWVRDTTDALGRELTDAEVAELAGALEAAGRPGGPEPVDLPAELAGDYAARDTSEELHRTSYSALLGRVTGAGTPLTGALYEAAVSGPGWTPYPDARPTLAALAGDGVRVAVVSNVASDLRVLFAGHGLAEFVDAWVLSHELGVMKPDPRMFTTALDALGVTPEQALMVGDNPRADGGAADLGIRTLLLPYSPAGSPHGLGAVLDLVRGDAAR